MTHGVRESGTAAARLAKLGSARADIFQKTMGAAISENAHSETPNANLNNPAHRTIAKGMTYLDLKKPRH